MPLNFSSGSIPSPPSGGEGGYYFLFLEQYYLLHKDFQLNTPRIVNFRVNQGTSIYLYDLEGKVLYYASKSLNKIQGDLGIHPNTCNNCLKEGKITLNFFKITNTLIEGASLANLTTLELASLIAEKKTQYLSNSSRVNLAIRLS